MRYVNETNYTLRKAEIRHLVTMQVWERGNKYSTCRPGGTFSNQAGKIGHKSQSHETDAGKKNEATK